MRNGLSDSDENIIAKLIEGDNREWASLYSRIRPSIIKHVQNNSGTKDDGNDIFQKTMEVLLNKLAHDRFTLTSSIKTYLFEVGRRLWLKELTKRKKISKMPDDIPDLDLSLEPPILTRRQQTALQCVSELAGKCKEIFRSLSEGKRMAEIALLVGLESEDAAKTMKYKCKKKVIDCIEKKMGQAY